MLKYLTIFLALIACNDGEFNPEQIRETRPLGTRTEPVMLTPGRTEAQLQLILATPTGTVISPISQTLTILDHSGGNPPQPIEVVTTTATTNHKTLDEWIMTYTFDVPASSSEDENPLTLYYDLTVNDTKKDIAINGKSLIYRADSSKATWQPPVIAITKPDGAVPLDTKSPLEGSISKNQDEKVRVHWYVPNGEVQNIYDITTKWAPDAAGEATIVLMVRGRDSQTMAYQFKDVLMQ